MPNTDPALQPEPATAPGAAKPGGPSKVCLVIIFNHRYDENLPKLDRLYRGRFEHVRYLVPFYRGERPDVFPVYYSSHQFQGYFMAAWRRLRGEGFTHFIFAADDLVLHPSLTSENFCAKVGLGNNSGYIKDMRSLAEFDLEWSATASTLVNAAAYNGVNWEKELPDPVVARKNLESKDYPFGQLGWHTLRRGVRAKGFFQILFYLILRWQKRRREPTTHLLDLPYPLLGGNSDLLVVPGSGMERFCFYSAVFAAMNLFVEVGAPTALGLSCGEVVHQDECGWTTRVDWYNTMLDDLGRQHGYRIDRLLADFGERVLYYHPIKFSKWSFGD